MSLYKAEYIWIDGTEPTPLLRSKTKIIPVGKEPPTWGFDGSSTNQAPGDKSDCVLKPVKTYPDPIRGGDDILVLCEVYTVDGNPHPSNTRAACREIAEKYAGQEMWFGMEQEYTLMKTDGTPLGFPFNGYPAPQGPYYCGVGGSRIFGRDIVEAHLEACLEAGITVSGINAEVMPGQWEYRIGPVGPLEVGDDMYMARWLLCRIAEEFDCDASFEAKPAKGDWNGAGCHTNFSTKAMREGWQPIIDACEALGTKAMEHVKAYGHGIEDRLTGAHETQRYDAFSYGVSDRGASIRIPWQCKVDGKGYAEDRRPNANCDPYVVAGMITKTVCSAAS